MSQATRLAENIHPQGWALPFLTYLYWKRTAMFQHTVSGDIISKSWAVPAENIFRYLPNIIQMTPQANLADIFSHMHNNRY